MYFKNIYLSKYEIVSRQNLRSLNKYSITYDTDSFDILIDNCCSHTLTNDINDYIEPPVKSSVRVRSFNGSTNKPWWEQTSGKSKMTMVKCTTSYYQTHVNGTLTIELKPGISERINIRRVIPYNE